MENEMIQDKNHKKRFLRRYRKNRAVLKRLEYKLANLDNQIYKIKTIKYTEQPKGGIPITLVDLLSEKEELEKRINKLSQKGVIIRAEILDKIDELDDSRYATVLESYFIECKGFVDIAEDMGYTSRHVERLYSEAINSMSF